MSLSLLELIAIAAAISAILMAGSPHLRTNLFLYAGQTLLIAATTFMTATSHCDSSLYYVALAIGAIKGIAIPVFLYWIANHIQVHRDAGNMIAPPIAMHLSVMFLGLSTLFARDLPPPTDNGHGWPGATAAISLLLTGLVIMLTRRIALSQILGFLVIENGIYLFALTQTEDMPMIIEMGVLLDVLVGVMIAGLLIYRIQKSFEHIDVTLLTELRD